MNRPVMLFVHPQCRESTKARRALDNLHLGSPNLIYRITTTSRSNAIVMIRVPHEVALMYTVGCGSHISFKHDMLIVNPSVASSAEVLQSGRLFTLPPDWQHALPQDMSTRHHVTNCEAVPERRARNTETTCSKHCVHLLYYVRWTGRRNRVAHRFLLGNADG